jgi:hypothetical protein
MHANRGNLASLGPDARKSRIPLGRDAKLVQGPDQPFFDLPQVPVKILFVPLEIEDRIANELARAVKGHTTATLDFKEIDPTGAEELRAHR